MNSNGSTLTFVLVGVAVAASGATFILSRSVDLSRAASKSSQSMVAENVATSIRSVLSKKSVCLHGFSGASSGTGEGLRFLGQSGASTGFNFTQAQSDSGQAIEVPGNYSSSGSTKTFVSGLSIPDTSLTLEKLYVTKAEAKATDTYTATVMAKFKSSQANDMNAIKVADLQLQFSGSTLTDCSIEEDASSYTSKSLCTDMGCTYTESTNDQGNCVCSLPAITCENGTYVDSIENNVPHCSTTALVKSCKQSTDTYLVGLDTSGSPICATAIHCPSGTSGSGLGGTANPSECKCNSAGATWNGSTCSTLVAINGTCGSANGTTVSTAPSSSLCSTGTPSSVSGSGPWSWTCAGSDGGSTASCSANKTSASCVLAAATKDLVWDGEAGSYGSDPACVVKNYLRKASGGTEIYGNYMQCPSNVAEGQTLETHCAIKMTTTTTGQSYCYLHVHECKN